MPPRSERSPTPLRLDEAAGIAGFDRELGGAVRHRVVVDVVVDDHGTTWTTGCRGVNVRSAGRSSSPRRRAHPWTTPSAARIRAAVEALALELGVRGAVAVTVTHDTIVVRPRRGRSRRRARSCDRRGAHGCELRRAAAADPARRGTRRARHPSRRASPWRPASSPTGRRRPRPRVGSRCSRSRSAPGSGSMPTAASATSSSTTTRSSP
jgi:hypothetical protein